MTHYPDTFNSAACDRRFVDMSDAESVYHAHHAAVMAAASQAFAEYPLEGASGRWLRDEMVGKALAKAETALGEIVSFPAVARIVRTLAWDDYGVASGDADVEAAKQALDSILHLYWVQIEKLEA